METKLLARADLNLLVALQVLLEERNVTRAAERLFITQPAMSKTLNRLRELFDDPLFTRSNRILVPTPRAEELSAALPAILGNIQSLIDQNTFDPSSYEGHIKIFVVEFIAHRMIPRLTQILAEECPKLTLLTASESEDLWKELGDGELDFSIAVARGEPKDILSTPLFAIEPMVWMRAGHPLAEKEKLNLHELLEYPFIQYFLFISGQVSANTETRFDKTLANKGLNRKRVLVTNQFMTAMESLALTDTVMLAARDDELNMKGYNIVQKPYPEELQFSNRVSVVLQEHVRTSQSQMHKWIRSKIHGVVAELYSGKEAFD